jgi:protein TonB
MKMTHAVLCAAVLHLAAAGLLLAIPAWRPALPDTIAIAMVYSPAPPILPPLAAADVPAAPQPDPVPRADEPAIPVPTQTESSPDVIARIACDEAIQANRGISRACHPGSPRRQAAARDDQRVRTSTSAPDGGKRPTAKLDPTPASPQPPAPRPVADPAAAESSLAAWRGALAAWLQSHRSYPEAARRDNQQGLVLVRFTVDRGGRVADVTIVASSGSATLDLAAQNMLQAAALPPFPPGMAQDSITVTVPIRYSLQR